MITSSFSRQTVHPVGISNSRKYQRHIDGLRAVAVLSVVFYHFGLAPFSGGFVGVDVFFVISGYLISNLIMQEMRHTGSFDFKRFYIRRMRRLLPAMGVTFAGTALLALAMYSPERLQAFGQSLAAAVFSVSNILFWSESGYFDADAHLKPLLHTWSLGVEEQFYLLWPALLWVFTRKAGPSGQLIVLATVGLLSFGLNYLWVSGHFDAEYTSTIFYLTPFRIFELVIGAMAIFVAPLLPDRRYLHEFGMLLGLALIAYAITTYTDDIVFPYLYALPPCIGALLVIVSRDARTVGRLLVNPVAVGIGLISYSMYLIHWPVLVFYEYYRFTPLNVQEYLALFAVTVLLSTLMYFFVEKTFRRKAPTRLNPAPQRAFVLTCGSAMMAIAVIGALIGVSDGVTWRNSHALTASEVSRGKDQRFSLVRSACNLTRLDNPKYCKMDRPYQILVMGNSHEPDGYNAFAAIYGQNRDVNLIAFGTFNGCRVEMTAAGPVSVVTDRQCMARVSLLNDESFVSALDGIVYSANQPFSQKRTTEWEILDHLHRLNKDMSLVVMGGYINTEQDCSELFNRFNTLEACKDPAHVSYNPFNERELHRTEGPATELDYLYIDKTALLCSGDTLESCAIQTSDEPAFYDPHHLSLSFATMLGQRIAKRYRQELVHAGFPPPL